MYEGEERIEKKAENTDFTHHHLTDKEMEAYREEVIFLQSSLVSGWTWDALLVPALSGRLPSPAPTVAQTTSVFSGQSQPLLATGEPASHCPQAFPLLTLLYPHPYSHGASLWLSW